MTARNSSRSFMADLVRRETWTRAVCCLVQGSASRQAPSIQRKGQNRLVAGSNTPTRRSSISDSVSISERPSGVEVRAVPRHWEGGLIQGWGESYFATFVERHSRFVILAQGEGAEPATRWPCRGHPDPDPPPQVAALAHPGPGPRVLGAHRFLDRHRHGRLLPRSAKPLAAREQRDHRRPLGPIPKKRPSASPNTSKKSPTTFAARLNHRPRKTLDSRTPAATP